MGWGAPAEFLEDRALLSNLNLITTAGNERITLGGGAEVNNFEVDYDGTNYTITDTSLTAVNAIGGLMGFDTNAAAHIVTFDPTAVAFFKRFDINGNGGDDTVAINSFRAGAEGLVIIDEAAEGTDAVTIAGDIGTAGSRVISDEVRIAGEGIDLSADIFTNNKAVQVGGSATGVALSGAAVIDAGTGAVTLDNVVDGANSLSVTGGAVVFNANVGSGTPLTDLTVVGTSVKTANLSATSTITIEADAYNQLGTLSGGGTADLTLRRHTSGVQSFNKNDLAFVAPGFNSVTIGSALTTSLSITSDGDNTIATGSFGFASDLTLIGGIINIADTIQQGADKLTLIANTTLAFTGIGGAVGTGDVEINKLVAGGTLTVSGKLGFASGTTPWGANATSVLAVGSTVAFTGGVGGSFTSFTATADALTFSATSALTAAGDVTLITTAGVSLKGGIFSTTGDISVTGAVTLTGNVLFKVAAGKDLTVNGSVTGGGNILVRGNGGAANNITFNGDVVTTGTFQIDSSGAATPLDVDLLNVTATNVVVRGVNVNLGGNLTATAGSVQVTGATTLLTNVILTSSGLANHFVRVDGAINGAFDLESQSGLGKTHFVGVIGGVTPLDDLLVRAGGVNFVYQNITVTSTVDWKSGDTANAGQDKLTVQAGKTITAGVSITLEADSVIANAVTQLFAPVETVISNGSP